MRTQRINRYLLLSLALTAAVFAGCNGSSNSSGPTGTLNLAVSDTPVDGATSVVVTFTGVEIMPRVAEDQQGDDGGEHVCAPPSVTNGTAPPAVGTPMPSADPGDMGDDGGDDNDCGDDDHTGAPSGGTSTAPSMGTTSAPSSATAAGDNDADDQGVLTFNFATPRTIDLMQQQGGNSASLLNGTKLPAGNYAWIRLMVASTGNTITLSDGSVHPLTIPSGDESGLKLVDGFTVANGGVVDFTIDFDLRRSVILANGQYILKPVLRLMNSADAGRISGTVANSVTIGSTAITDPSCMPAAYIFSGSSATPVDINPTSATQPVATASVKLDNESGNYEFSAGFLAPGAYTVALVCAAGDNPATVDTLTFSPPKGVTVASDNTATVSFP